MEISDLVVLLVTFAVCCASKLKTDVLQGYGIYPVTWDSKALIFYVTLKNEKNCPVTATVKKIKCCEEFSNKSDIGCNHMRLYDSRITLEQHSVTNCTLLYPNTYPYNRKGTCNVNIIIEKNQKELAQFQQDIPFNTTIQEKNIFILQQSTINVEKIFRLCEHPDEDPLDLCAPVNCHMKYQGFRSLFDYVKRQCIPIPVCDGGTRSNSTNIVYDLFSNKCIQTTDRISITDIDRILNNKLDQKIGPESKTKYYRSSIQCHHGKMDKTNRSCICDYGWESAGSWSYPLVTTVPVHMCTIKTRRKSFYEIPQTMKTLEFKTTFWTLSLTVVWYLMIQFGFFCLFYYF